VSAPVRRRKRPVRLHWLDFVVLAVLAGAIAYIAYRVDTVLNYRWNWDSVLPFLAYYDEDKQRWVANLLLEGLLTSVRLAVYGIVISTVIGVLMGFLRTVANPTLRMVARSYVELVRNMPPIVFIFVFYFFLSGQLMPLLGVDDFARNASEDTRAVLRVLAGEPQLFSNFVAGLLCLAVFEGAYITEIVRAGIQSIPRGQWEAGTAMGLSRLDLLRFVILPQAIQRIVPPLANQFINLIKDSSFVSLISIQELTFMAIDVGVSTTRVFEVWTLTAGLYFVVCYGCALALKRMERRMARSRR